MNNEELVMEKRPLFVLHGPDGHVWRIYENGRYEGFPEGTSIENWALPTLNALRSRIIKFDATLVSELE